jgi:hypothetical protein
VQGHADLGDLGHAPGAAGLADDGLDQDVAPGLEGVG